MTTRKKKRGKMARHKSISAMNTNRYHLARVTTSKKPIYFLRQQYELVSMTSAYTQSIICFSNGSYDHGRTS